MKAKIVFYNPDEEAERRAEDLGLPPPEKKLFKSELYFRLKEVNTAYITSDRDIAIHLPSGAWILEYDEELWTRIVSELT
jgi:hypothetical protein